MALSLDGRGSITYLARRRRQALRDSGPHLQTLVDNYNSKNHNRTFNKFFIAALALDAKETVTSKFKSRHEVLHYTIARIAFCRALRRVLSLMGKAYSRDTQINHWSIGFGWYPTATGNNDDMKLPEGARLNSKAEATAKNKDAYRILSTSSSRHRVRWYPHCSRHPRQPKCARSRPLTAAI